MKGGELITLFIQKVGYGNKDIIQIDNSIDISSFKKMLSLSKETLIKFKNSENKLVILTDLSVLKNDTILYIYTGNN